MDDDFFSLILLAASAHYKRKSRQRKRRMWVHPFYQTRKQYGEFHTLVNEMSNDPEMYFTYFRMSKEDFAELLSLTEHRLEHLSIRAPLSAAERLAITLRFLATGNSFAALSLSFRVAKSTISNIIKEVTKVLWEELQPRYLKQPNESEWTQIVSDFWTKWQFPNCCGSMDGRHIPILCPPISAQPFAAKQPLDINLIGVCDANHCFTIVDVGSSRQNTAFGDTILKCSPDIPHLSLLPGTSQKQRVVFVGDLSFPLKENLMRPYAAWKELTDTMKIFNYRLSRATSIADNTLGVLMARWQVLRVRMRLLPNTADYVVLACCCLHNFVQKRENQIAPEKRIYCPEDFIDREDDDGNLLPGEWRNELSAELSDCPTRLGSNNFSRHAQHIRDIFAEYFMHPSGLVHWQFKHLYTGNSYM